MGVLQESAHKAASNPVVRYHLGMAYYKHGDRALAQEELQHALRLSQHFPGAEEAKAVLIELQMMPQ